MVEVPFSRLNENSPPNGSIRSIINGTPGSTPCVSGSVNGVLAFKSAGVWHCPRLAVGAGDGDVAGPVASSDSELVLYSGVGGKTLKRSNALNGIPFLTSGVVSMLTSSGTGNVARVTGPAITGMNATSAFSTGTIPPDRIISGGVINSRCLRTNSSGQIVVATDDCGAGGGGLADPGGNGLIKRTSLNVTTPALAGVDFVQPTGSGAGLTNINFTQLVGSAIDAQIPNNITVDQATLALTANVANAGDNASAFFSAGTIEANRLPDLSGLNGSVIDDQVPNNITINLAAVATLANTATLATTATIANSGDSATAFFTTGSIEAARGGTGLGLPGDDQVIVGNGTTFEFKTIPSCSNATNDKLLYNSTTNAFSCGADQASGGGSGITSLNALTGATQTFSKTDDTNVTLTITSTGTDHNFALGFTGTLTDSRVADNITLTNITQITNRALVNTTGDLLASRIDDGGAAATQALFSGAGSSAGFRAIADADIPNNITIDLATLATTALTANEGDSATAFFSAGTIEPARLITGAISNSRCLRVDGSGNIAVHTTDCGLGGGGGDVTLAGIETFTGLHTFDPAKLKVGAVSTLPAVVPQTFAVDSDDGRLYFGVDAVTDYWGEVFVSTLSGAINVANGGTGATTLTGLLQGNGTSAFTAITNSTTVGQILRVTGSNTYAWGALNLADTDAVTGVLPAANILATVTNSRCLRVNGSGVIEVHSADCGVGGGGGDMVLADSQVVTGRKEFDPGTLVVGNDATLPTPELGAFAIDTDDGKLYFGIDGSNWGEVLISGLSGPVAVASGGTGAATLTGLLQGNGTSAVTVITNSTTVGQVLRVTGSNAYGWGAVNLADTDAVTGILPAANVLATVTNSRCLRVNGSGVIEVHSADCGSGGGGITNSAGNNVIPKSDGTNIIASNIMDISGVAIIGHTAALGRLGQQLEITTSANFGGVAFNGFSTNGVEAAFIDFNRSKSATKGTHSVVAGDDALGYFAFRGSDGTDFQNAAGIFAHVDGTPGAADMPGRLSFWTSPDGSATVVERMRISSTGHVSVVGTGAFGGDVTVPDEAYDATGWNASLEVPTKNAVRDKLETMSSTVANGTSALGTSAIASGACATVVTTTATGTATTDVVSWGFNGDPTGVTGYAPSVNGMLTIIAYPSANNVNYKVCNNTSASVTPGAITLNWRIIR